MNNDIKLIAEAYDQQMNDMKAALNAPPESRDSGAVLLDDEGHYFEWWKDVHGYILGTIYDKNDDFVTDEIDIDYYEPQQKPEWNDVVRAKGLRSLKTHKANERWQSDEFKGNIVTTIEELKALPEKTIIWYPPHDMEFGMHSTRNALLTYLEDPESGNDHIGFLKMGPKAQRAMRQASKETGSIFDEGVDDHYLQVPILTPFNEPEDGDIPKIIEFADHMKAKGWGFAAVPYSTTTAPEIRDKWSFD